MLIEIDEASILLNKGEVVAIPTETVFGLAARADSHEAVAKLYALKGRPQHNPLIIHVSGSNAVTPFLSTIPPHYKELSDAFWPGPLTLVLPIHQEKIPPIVRAGLLTCAFRAPKHPDAQALIKKTGPLVAPSANLSGRPSSTTPLHIEEDFGAQFPVLKGLPPEGGVESTILIFQDTQWFLGRRGMIPKERLEAILGYPLQEATSEKILCPGQLLRHYAPSARLFLTLKPKRKMVVGYSDRSYDNASTTFSLGNSQDPEEVAKNLYTTLRALDQAHIEEADVDIDIPQNGLWHTIIERLTRAASRYPFFPT